MKQLNTLLTHKKISFVQWLLAWGALFLMGNFFTEDILKSSLGYSLSMYWLYFIGTVGLISYEFVRRESSIRMANIFALVVWLMHAYIYITLLLQYRYGYYEAIKSLYLLTLIEVIIVSVFLITKILVKRIKSKDLNDLN